METLDRVQVWKAVDQDNSGSPIIFCRDQNAPSSAGLVLG